VWQELYLELRPLGLEIVTVALDAAGAETARPWVEKAGATHPSLVDRAHVVDALFGIVNVPSGVWIDEAGTIVRPPEPAHPRRPEYKDRAIPADATPAQCERIETVRALHVEAERYVAALRDWVTSGASSRFALTRDEVVRRSRPRPIGEATAPAHFALGQELHARGFRDDAIAHFKEAHRLDPTNWTYRRDAWSLVAAEHEAIYGTSWLAEVKREGVERYYPPLEMPDNTA
jgi:tetratricopeptide (TPR) repeat protein